MKFFAFISLLAALMLGITVEQGLKPSKVSHWQVPSCLRSYQEKIKSSFEKPENANLYFSFMTGNKNGISPRTKAAFKIVNLSFLMSPSGLHLSAMLFFITWPFKKISSKWIKKTSHFSILIAFLFSGVSAIKRLVILRLLFQFRFLSKIKLNSESIFFLTFCISFIIGDFHSSPLSFIYSFIFLGTFFSLRNNSKLVLIIGLFSTQLIIGIFMGEKVSLLSIPIGLLGSFLFSFLFPLLLIFLGSFFIFPFNWVEPLMKVFIFAIKFTARGLNGTFTSSSVFLITAVWVFFLMKAGKRKYAALFIFIFLHTNTAMTPVIFTPNLPSKTKDNPNLTTGPNLSTNISI